MEDAVKILRGQSADLFPESVIDQLFKDTFESDIFLTSADYFVVDPLVFFTSEFEQEINSLWYDRCWRSWWPAVFQFDIW